MAVMEQVSADATPVTDSPTAVAITPASESTEARTRPGESALTTDIDGAPQRFFTTSVPIGTLHVDLERCNLEGFLITVSPQFSNS
jgi:hypothetical protein